MPKKLKTAEQCRAAVNKDGRALQFVPKGLRAAVTAACAGE